MKLKWIVLVFAIIAGAVFLYLALRKSTDFEPLIKTKLKDLVAKASNGLYKLEVEKIEIDVLNSSATALNVTLIPDSAVIVLHEQSKSLPDNLYNISLKALHITGLSPQDLIDGKNIDLNELVLDSPQIVITHKKRNYNVEDSGSFYERIAPQQQSYVIRNLLLNNIQLTYKNQNKNNQVSKFQNVNARFTDVKIDSFTVKDSTRFLFAKNAMITLAKYSTTTADKMYQFSIDSVALDPQQATLNVTNIRLKPVGTKDEFSKKLSFQKDMFDIFIDNGIVENVNWWDLLGNDGLFCSRAKMEGGYVKIYHDRSLPLGKSKVGNYPHQLLMKADLPIHMNYLALQNVKVSYEEFNPRADKSGIIEFNNLDGEISNITNVQDSIAASPMMKAKGTARLMNNANLKAVFAFDLSKAAAGVFMADAWLGVMDGKKINKATEGLGLVKIDDLIIDKLEAHLKGTNNNASGTVQFAYHDLKVTVLKKDEDDYGNLKKRKILSFIVNKFVIKEKSPKPGEQVKTYSVTHERDAYKSFFNLIWKTISEGVIQTVRGK
jgi:hypothetical protein